MAERGGVLGGNNSLYINMSTDGSDQYLDETWVQATAVGDVNIDDAPQEVDGTTRKHVQAGTEAVEAGVRNPSITAPLKVKRATDVDLVYDRIMEKRRDEGVLDVLHVEGGLISVDNLRATRMLMHVFGDFDQPMTTDSMINLTLRYAADGSGQDGPIRGTVTSSAFVPE